MSWQEVAKKCVEVSGVFGSLSHPVRVKLLCQLLDGEKSVGDLALECEIEQPIASQFLARMRTDGLVNSKRDGKFVLYQIADPRLRLLMETTRKLYCQTGSMKPNRN